jgi:hypothetical protein
MACQLRQELFDNDAAVLEAADADLGELIDVGSVVARQWCSRWLIRSAQATGQWRSDDHLR